MAGRTTLILIIALLLAGQDMAWATEKCGRQEISPAQLAQIVSEGGANYMLLDMRSSKVFLEGTILGAINIGQLGEILANDTHQDVDYKLVVIVTETGQPNDRLREWIEQLCNNKTEVWILQGGVLGWLSEDLVLEDPKERLTVPGSVPFLIPRGLCELNEPVQEFN